MPHKIILMYKNWDNISCEICKEKYIINLFIKTIKNLITMSMEKVYKVKESGFTAGQHTFLRHIVREM